VSEREQLSELLAVAREQAEMLAGTTLRVYQRQRLAAVLAAIRKAEERLGRDGGGEAT